MSISPQFLDELRSRLPLSEVIGRRTKVTRAGREYKACCPFHKEKTPSFTINDQKQFYHCFGCGAHGDVVGFTMQHDNLSFVEAVEALASQAGMQMPRPDPAFVAKEKKNKDLYAVVEAACAWFEQQLHDARHRDVLEYVLNRGILQTTMSGFRIGYAPQDGQALRTHMIAQGFTDADMIEAGVLKASTKGTVPYSFFRDRVMFPVSDRRGRVVAFGGRVLPEDMRPPQRSDFTPPKYMNSSDTPLFHKGKMLFGEAQARQAARDGHTPIVVEGYLDVIVCHQAGFQGAVAPLGTAVTEDQILSLWSMIHKDEKNPVLCFDGDNAGRRAAERACERMLPLLKPNHSATLAFLPDGEDPDSFIQGQGREAFIAHLKQAQNLSDFIWDTIVGDKVYDTPEAKAGLEQAVARKIENIQDSVVQGHYRSTYKNKIWELFRAKRAPFKKEWQGNKGRGGNVQNNVALSRPTGAGHQNINMDIVLATFINHPFLLLDFSSHLESGMIMDERAQMLCDNILNWFEDQQEKDDKILDSDELKHHLIQAGSGDAMKIVLGPRVYNHASFARQDASETKARQGLNEMIRRIVNTQLEDDLRIAQRELLINFSPESEARVLEMRRLLEQGRQSLSEGQMGD